MNTKGQKSFAEFCTVDAITMNASFKFVLTRVLFTFNKNEFIKNIMWDGNNI